MIFNSYSAIFNSYSTRCVAPSWLSDIYDESEQNNCFII